MPRKPVIRKRPAKQIVERPANPEEISNKQWEEIAAIAVVMAESDYLGGNEAKCLIAAFLEWVQNGTKCLGIDEVENDQDSLRDDFQFN